MSAFERLIQETSSEREAFIAIPVIQRALSQGVPREMYLDFLGQAYHHVRHTCRLLSTAVARSGDGDDRYSRALLAYIEEERGHEDWVLDDIQALGGDAAAVRDGSADLPCRLMVAYVYYAVEHVSPYAMLGMVHVLEGMSAALAVGVAAKLQATIGGSNGKGFSYLSSHGALDQVHVAFFREVVDGIDDAAALGAVIETARVVYRLYGDIFRSIDARHGQARDAA